MKLIGNVKMIKKISNKENMMDVNPPPQKLLVFGNLNVPLRNSLRTIFSDRNLEMDRGSQGTVLLTHCWVNAGRVT